MVNLKEIVLQQSNYGLDFFKFVINGLELKDEDKCELVLNPFYHDTKPGLSIYLNDETQRWMFNDFGDENFKGDVFDFAALHYELDAKKDFYKILKLMADDLGIEYQNKYSEAVTKAINVFGYKVDYKNGDGLEEAFDYFKQFGITKSILRSYRVRAIQRAYYTGKDNRIKSRYFKEGEFFISFEHVYFAKVYSPDPKGFFYVGSKPKDFVFGFSQIIGRAHRAKSFPETLILTGGEKDVLTLTALGYDAVSLNSETAAIPKSLTENLFNAYKNIIVLYDNDETGIRQSVQIRDALKHKFNVSICRLPEVVNGRQIKDVSDYMKHALPIDGLRQLIQSSSQELRIAELPEKKQVVVKNGNDKSPVFPDWIYARLPKFLHELSMQFQEPIERDLTLLSSLAVLSSCFPKVRGNYGHNKVAANLYLFVIAPASAGKGVMMYGRRLAAAIQLFLASEYRKAQKKYMADHAEYRANVHDNPDLEEPEKPQQKIMIIPANTSVSKMIQILGANRDFGLIFESEGDTLAMSLKNDWGNFSDVLRKAAHHETVSMARRQNDEFIEITNPCLSVVLSGTPNQVKELVGGVENGLTSRFCFYNFEGDNPWKNQFAIPDVNREKVFTKATEYMYHVWTKQADSPETIINVPEFLAERHTEFFDEKYQSLRLEHSGDIVPNVRRHGLMCFRIAMLLTIFRNLEQNEWLAESLNVCEEDMDLALAIMDVLMKHLATVFKRLESGAIVAKLNSKQRELIAALPDAFSKKEYTSIRIQLGIKDDVAEKYIRDFTKHGAISRIEQGQYRKAA